MKINLTRLCLLLLIAPACALPGGAQAPDPWSALQQENATTAGAGYVLRLRQGGFSSDQARQILALLTEAQRQAVPAATLTARLDEGLAKKAAPQAIVSALETRLRTMTQARAMVRTAEYDAVPAAVRDELLIATGLALESGVAADDLQTVMRRGNGQAALRTKSVVEAGETLHLAGVDRETTRTLMDDCMQRNLRRMEVLRAVRYSIQQHKSGMNGDNIRRSLWGGNAAVEGARGWRGGGQGGTGNCDSTGTGSGAGQGWRGGTESGRPPATSDTGSGSTAPAGGGGLHGAPGGAMGGGQQYMGGNR